MKVMRAKTAGFCMGVGLALRKLDEAVAASAGRSGRLLMLGPIIHNPQALEAYAAKGVLRADSLDDIRPGDTVVIRAHGIPREDETRLAELGANVVDATCPKVKRAQLAIAEATADGRRLYLFGEAEHPEVRGLVSYAGGPCLVFDRQDAPSPPGRDEPAAVAAQTTQERSEFEALCARLATGGAPLVVLSTICDATRRRQDEAAALARETDAVIVVGGRESGNTRRLADVVRAAGIPALHVETAEELREEDSLRNYAIVGITAGASTPKQLIDAVQHFLETQAGK